MANRQALRRCCCGISAVVLYIGTSGLAAAWDSPQWVRQLGIALSVISHGVATDGDGNIYISGETCCSFGEANTGSDAWIAKYSTSGELLWKRQLGTADSDLSNDVATDEDGNVYVCGQTEGSLAGVNQGGFDAFVAKYSSRGVLRWKRQVGTSVLDRSTGVAADRKGNDYIGGYMEGSLAQPSEGGWHAFVVKYSPMGELRWKRQLGKITEYELNYAEALATDYEGNVYISGYSDGFDGGPDSLIAKYSGDGVLLWRNQLGTPDSDHSRRRRAAVEKSTRNT